jgi:uncharacterized membrane protein
MEWVKKKGEYMKLSTIVTVIFLFLVSIAHLLRFIFQVKVTAGSFEIPVWMSIPACIVTAALATWLWWENKK